MHWSFQAQQAPEGLIHLQATASLRPGWRLFSLSMPEELPNTRLGLDSGQQVTYQIVGDDEADIKQGRISINSPIARALIGKEAGDVVDAQTPGGVKQYEIIDVRYE